MYIFGGYDGNQYLNDLWVFSISSKTWTLLKPRGELPSVRDSHSAVYSPDANVMYVFGGYSVEVYFNDVWAYDVSQNLWRLLKPEGDAPSERDRHTAIYTARSNSMVVFGGGGNDDLNDVWSLSFNTIA